MQITLIERGRLVTMDLPSKINGQYWVEHLNPMGAKEKVLSIEGVEGRWIVKSGRHAVLQNKDLEQLRDCPLQDGDCIPLLFKRTGEQALLLANQVRPADLAYKKLVVPNGSTLRFGGHSSNDVVLEGRFIAEYHMELTFADEAFVLQTLDQVHGVYVNGQRAERMNLAPGDVIYLMGVLLVIGRDFFAINHMSQIQGVNQQLLGEFPLQEVLDLTTEEYFDDLEVENVFYRSPRFKRDVEERKLTLDSPPGKVKEQETPLMITLGPSITMGMASMFSAWYSVSNVLNSGGDIKTVMPTVVMAGSMLAGSLIWPFFARNFEKKNARRKEKIRRKKYYAYLEKIKGSIAEETVHQSEVLHENLISLEGCVNRIKLRERTLWERMPEHNDFLKLRLGMGELPLEMDLSHQTESFTVEEDELRDAMYLLANAPRMVKEVPVPLSLVDNFVTGVIGPREESKVFTRNLLFQLATLHSYMDLKIVFLYDESEKDQWEFVRWLPHCWDNEETIRFVVSNNDELKEISAYFERMLAQRKEQKEKELSKDQPRYVFFSTSRSLAKRAEMLNQVLQMDEYQGFSTLLVYDELTALPKECDIVIELAGQSSKVYDRGDITGKNQLFRPDLGVEFSSKELAVSLANIKLDQSEKAFNLPQMLTFMEMYQAEKVEHLNPLERWKENNPVNTLQAPIGVISSGDLFYLDLHEKYHGPHGLIAGMTGSGKSEFIMTYILSLALNYHPYEVAFILIDYKGGGMANAFTDLPHLAGTITNLDGAAVNRSLVSIESELKRRQAIFGETSKQVGVSNVDIYKYQKLFREGTVTEPLQHLFIISDEFAELKTQEPEFMAQLVSAARIGRSLGIHLILATQKPSGVVDDQIWSNSRFRICLKVQEKSDSQDVIKRPDAAELSVTGRFYVQVGFDEVFELGQSAWGGAPYLPDQDLSELVDDRVVFIDHLGRAIKEVRPPRKTKQVENPPKQLDEITKYLKKLAEEEGIKVRQLWLEPIAPVIFVDKLEEKYKYTAKPYLLEPIIGEYDSPAEQAQLLLTMDLSGGGNTVIYGAGGNGKTTFLTTIIYSTIRYHSPEEVNFYILDFSSETLRAFRKAPQVGDVIFGSEEEKVQNLFRMLEGELAQRKKVFADYGGDYASYTRAIPGTPRIVVAVHNYAAFKELYENLAEEALTLLTREGNKYGITFIVTCGGTSDIRYRLMQNFSKTYSMQLNDPSDYNMIFPSGEKPSLEKHKGRGLFYDGQTYEFQTAYAGDPEDVFTQVDAYCIALADAYEGARAPAIPVLPEICNVAFLLPYLQPSKGSIPVGVDHITLEVLERSFEGMVNLVASDMVENSLFMGAVAELYSRSGADLTVLDPGDMLEGERSFTTATGLLAVKPKVEELSLLINQRHKLYKNAIASGEEPPSYTEKIYVIQDINGLLEMLDDTEKTNLGLSLFHGIAEYNVKVILSTQKVAAIAREDWFNRQGLTDSYVWVGTGIHEQYTLRITGNVQELRTRIPDDFGYLVDKAKYRLAKLALPDGIAFE